MPIDFLSTHDVSDGSSTSCAVVNQELVTHGLKTAYWLSKILAELV